MEAGLEALGRRGDAAATSSSGDREVNAREETVSSAPAKSATGQHPTLEAQARASWEPPTQYYLFEQVAAHALRIQHD